MRNCSFFAIVLISAILSSCSQICEKADREAVFNVASYNIRQINDADSVAGNGWAVRCPVLAQVIRYHEFDIFGTQEGFLRQLSDLKSALPGYDYIGAGREDGIHAGEHSAIFYRTDKFEVIEKGDFWLSETPDVPSVGWDAVLPRICSWGHFRHIDSGREFLFYNLHMDHIGKQARVESAALVLRKMEESGGGLPVFLTGDFNVDQTHSSYSVLTSGKLADAYETCGLRYALNGTFNDYATDNYTDSRIDHIFVSPSVKVEKYGVLTDTYRSRSGESAGSARHSANAPQDVAIYSYVARTPSDHFPVAAKVRL